MATSIITSTRTASVTRRNIVSKATKPNLSPGHSPTSSEPTSIALQAHCSSTDVVRLCRQAEPELSLTCDPVDDIDDEPYLPPSLRIRFNVSGQSYETKASAFDRHPDTIFGDPEKRRPYWDARRREYFFDRHRPSFEAVFAYIVEGRRLTRPQHIPVDIFLKEIAFYELKPEVIGALKKFEGIEDDVRPLPTGRFKRATWMLFEYPDSSTSASIIGIVSVGVTLIAILLLCVETMPYFADAKKHIDCEEDADKEDDMSGIDVGASSVSESDSGVDPFFLVESICVAWFTFELLIRFVACPSKLNFWKDFNNLIDVVSVLPYYVDLIMHRGNAKCVTAMNSSTSSSPSLSYLRSIRLARIFKLTKHCVGLQVLIKTFTASFAGLGMFMMTLSVCVMIYSSVLYYAELNVPESTIHSIPDAFWWAIITMTTVGYGDAVPVGLLGRVVGTACAVSGILTLAIPVPIIAGHFNRFYSSMTGRHHHTL